MHDIDRIQTEFQPESEMLQGEQFEFEAYETPGYGELNEVFNETEEMELASELLEVTGEEELDRFLGKLIKRAGRVVGRLVPMPTGQALGGILKGAARQVLPMLGSTVGGFAGGAYGSQLGSQVASAAGRLLGLELEGLSSEDQEFEVAKQYVRFAGQTVKNAAVTPAGSNPMAAAQNAAVQAAQIHAPGLLKPAPQRPAAASSDAAYDRGRSGRWVRRGNKIILYGL